MRGRWMCSGQYLMSKHRWYCVHQANRHLSAPRPMVTRTHSGIHPPNTSDPGPTCLISELGSPFTSHNTTTERCLSQGNLAVLYRRSRAYILDSLFGYEKLASELRSATHNGGFFLL
ncbi:hypothetical protein DPSP01_013605 [Paraphaeosphaeria sporulosa]